MQVAVDSWTLACRAAGCGKHFIVPVHRGRPPAYCSDECRGRGRRPPIRLVRGHLPMGDKPVLYPTEIEEVLEALDRIDRYPNGERGRARRDLAERFGVSVRTIDRYRQYGEIDVLRIGPWWAYFATRSRGKRRDPAAPVQLTAWVKETQR